MFHFIPVYAHLSVPGHNGFKQHNIYDSLIWQDGKTPSSKWTGVPVSVNQLFKVSWSLLHDWHWITTGSGKGSAPPKAVVDPLREPHWKIPHRYVRGVLNRASKSELWWSLCSSMNKRMNKQLSHQWFDMPWRTCDDTVMLQNCIVQYDVKEVFPWKWYT